MGALLDHPAIAHCIDAVAVHHVCQTVGDQDDRLFSGQTVDGLHDIVLALGIHIGSGLVEEVDGRIVQQGAGHGKALALPADATAETTIIGKAVLIREWCLAWDKNNGCRFCYDACPYEAIELDENMRPVVIPDHCNGCGACQSVCVSQKEGSYTTGATSRAIIVVPESEA